MGKFSDPNYNLLKSYFDILVAVRTGTDKSYLIGPNKTVVSDGGLYTILYEDNPDRGYVGHRFIIKEIDGNRFKMTYEGLESTFSVASSAFDISNEMYFRKDSFFHYWLARPDQDDLYHDYCNQEKTFLFFGKIWPVSNENNTYSIEFEGLKDFTLKGLPQTNQTINMEEWLKVYWDQVHHEMYNMTKGFWSMFDAREIDLRWLGYISNIYGIEVSEQVLNELPLREWVENLPYFLKRIGTYNALYIIWKVFLSNTSNKLNVYERWGEWCVQNLDQIVSKTVDDFEDHHFLEFYGTQPSGGAGDYYYSRYNPNDYPTHTLKAPSGECQTYKWGTGIGENYLVFTLRNLNCSVGDIKEKEINVTGYDPLRVNTQSIFLSGGSYTGDFSHSTGINMYSTTVSASNIVCWALSNEIAQISDHVNNNLSLSYEISGGSRRFKLIENYSGVDYSVSTTGTYNADVSYYITVNRVGSLLRLSVFDKERKWVDDLLETITLTLNSIESYSILYALNAMRINNSSLWYGKILGHYLDASLIEAIAVSGSPVITPHYKVQVDLSSEPLGDIFNDNTIISEDIIDELIKNFEYVRPVSKYVHYEELIAPLARIDRVGDSVPLYPLTSNGYMNTFFTGSQYISAGNDGGLNTFSYFQQYASKEWTITHGLDSPYLLVQPWVFTQFSSIGAKVIKPETIYIVDNNTVQLTFKESFRGIASIAGPVNDVGISYTGTTYTSAASATWIYNHNLDTLTPSAYTSPPGPIMMHWENGYRVIPEIIEIINQNTIESTFGVPISGGSLIRRSDYIHTQNSSSITWQVNHGMNSWVICQCYDLLTNEEIIPEEIIIVDGNNLIINWSANKRGYAHLIKVPKDKVIYSPYECDEHGIGICADVLGYWKIGTGTDTTWNPYIENNLETPVTSGSYKAVEDDLNNIYIDFIVPSDFNDVKITEVGLFNYLDQLILYSRCSDLFKPKGVQCFFHYRTVKLNSSSSSSSSSSVSSSSSSISSSSSSS